MTAQGIGAGAAPRSVRVIYISRTLSFAYAFGVLALLAWQRGMGGISGSASRSSFLPTRISCMCTPGGRRIPSGPN